MRFGWAIRGRRDTPRLLLFRLLLLLHLAKDSRQSTAKKKVKSQIGKNWSGGERTDLRAVSLGWNARAIQKGSPTTALITDTARDPSAHFSNDQIGMLSRPFVIANRQQPPSRPGFTHNFVPGSLSHTHVSTNQRWSVFTGIADSCPCHDVKIAEEETDKAGGIHLER